PASVTHVGNGTNAVTAVAMRSGSHPVQFVRFSLTGARATNVTVAGTFNGWNASATPLRQVDSVTWVADVPLKAGRYTYQFVLDNRKWVPDPHAPRDTGDDFGTSNSVVTVTGESGS
ncbi:MAG: isoamylase early set domain-containing protein, partial [Gemmatimonadaceae bacterium]